MPPVRTVIFQSVALIAAPASFFSSTAIANSLPSFTPKQIQRITRDITPTLSQDFFRSGKAQIEREVRLVQSATPKEPLERRRGSLPRQLLNVEPNSNLQQNHQPQPFQQNRLYLNRRNNFQHP